MYGPTTTYAKTEAYRFDSSSGWGWGISFGKEWWVSANWGLGLALSYYQHSLEGESYYRDLGSTANLGSIIDEEYKGRARHRYYALSFSATYN